MGGKIVPFLLVATIPYIVSGVVFADVSAVPVSKTLVQQNVVQCEPSPVQLAQISASKPTLSDADKKMLESQLQKFQVDEKEIKKKSANGTSLKDLILRQRELNRVNANINRLNQTPTDNDKSVK